MTDKELAHNIFEASKRVSPEEPMFIVSDKQSKQIALLVLKEVIYKYDTKDADFWLWMGVKDELEKIEV